MYKHICKILTITLVVTHFAFLPATKAEIDTQDIATFSYQESQAIYGVAFSPDGSVLASAHADGLVRLWDMESGENIATLEGHEGIVFCVGFSLDGSVIASGGEDKTVRLWDAESGDELAILEGHEDAVHGLAFTPYNEVISAGGGKSLVWDIETSSSVGELSAGTTGVAVNSNATAISMADGASVMMLNLTTIIFFAPVAHDTDILSIAFHPTELVLASGSEDGVIKLTQIELGSQMGQDEGIPLISLEDNSGEVYSLAFSPDGESLASGSGDGKVRLWDIDEGKLSQTIEGHTGAVYSVTFNPEGTLIVSAGEDGNIQLWDSSTGENVRSLGVETPSE